MQKLNFYKSNKNFFKIFILSFCTNTCSCDDNIPQERNGDNELKKNNSGNDVFTKNPNNNNVIGKNNNKNNEFGNNNIGDDRFKKNTNDKNLVRKNIDKDNEFEKNNINDDVFKKNPNNNNVIGKNNNKDNEFGNNNIGNDKLKKNPNNNDVIGKNHNKYIEDDDYKYVNQLYSPYPHHNKTNIENDAAFHQELSQILEALKKTKAYDDILNNCLYLKNANLSKNFILKVAEYRVSMELNNVFNNISTDLNLDLLSEEDEYYYIPNIRKNYVNFMKKTLKTSDDAELFKKFDSALTINAKLNILFARNYHLSNVKNYLDAEKKEKLREKDNKKAIENEKEKILKKIEETDKVFNKNKQRNFLSKQLLSKCTYIDTSSIYNKEDYEEVLSQPIENIDVLSKYLNEKRYDQLMTWVQNSKDRVEMRKKAKTFFKSQDTVNLDLEDKISDFLIMEYALQQGIFAHLPKGSLPGMSIKGDTPMLFLVRRIESYILDSMFEQPCHDGKHIYKKTKMLPLESWSLLNPVKIGKYANSVQYGNSVIYGDVPVYAICMSMLSGLNYKRGREFVVMPCADLEVIVKRNLNEALYKEQVFDQKMKEFNDIKQ